MYFKFYNLFYSKTFISIFIFNFFLSFGCQNKYSEFSNVDFNIGYVSGIYKNDTLIRPAYMRMIVNLPERLKDSLNNLPSKQVFQLLENSRMDWVINLLLYEQYEKDATLFLVEVKDRKDWLPYKENDIKYWKKHIK